MTICNEVGYLIANGKRVATLRCGEEAGHTLERPANHRLMQPIPGTPHVARLEWEEPAREIVDDWPERYDADEKHDVEVPMLSDKQVAALEGDYFDAWRSSETAREQLAELNEAAARLAETVRVSRVKPHDDVVAALERANATIRRLRRAVMVEAHDDEHARAVLAAEHDVEVPMLSTREFAALVQPPEEEPADLAEFDAAIARGAHVDRMIDGRREGD